MRERSISFHMIKKRGKGYDEKNELKDDHVEISFFLVI